MHGNEPPRAGVGDAQLGDPFPRVIHAAEDAPGDGRMGSGVKAGGVVSTKVPKGLQQSALHTLGRGRGELQFLAKASSKPQAASKWTKVCDLGYEDPDGPGSVGDHFTAPSGLT